MQITEANAVIGMALLEAADLQDNLLTVANDLERLQGLLSEASDTLLAGFLGASHELRSLEAGAGAATGPIGRALVHLGHAVTALQFQDMSSQLIAHTSRRLRHCTDRLASDTFADEEDGDGIVEALPLRPNPVTQDEMDAGSIDLF